jgi:hypothetical protein
LPDKVRKLARPQTLGQRSLNGFLSFRSAKQIGSLIARSRHPSPQEWRELYTPGLMIANGPLTMKAIDATKGSYNGDYMRAQVNGITIAYNDRGTGLPIVFFHAFPLNRTMWATQEKALSSQFRIITIDLREHGESDAPLWRYTLDQSADDVSALLDQLAIQQALFVGLSMGGYILFTFYLKYASRVKGLILADTRAQADTSEGIEGRFQMAQTAYTQ